MRFTFRQYSGQADYQRVDRFLLEQHQTDNADGNWLEPAWEYMHGHPLLNKSALNRIGIWEEDGQIVAVAHYEWRLGEAFFQFRQGYQHLRETLLDYAETHLYGVSEKDGRHFLQAYVNDNDPPFQALVQARGYVKDPDSARPLAQMVIPQPFPAIQLPEGYRLKSMADDFSWDKIHRVLWRGFNHPGEPPEDDLDERKAMQNTPNFQHHLKIMVEAPNGDYAAFCGMWYEPQKSFAYVEPVATDPHYRRMGLGRAAVLEGIRRCAELGAKTAYVGSDQAFYLSFGFKVLFTSDCWFKTLEGLR